MCDIVSQAIEVIDKSDMTPEQKMLAKLFFNKLDKIETKCNCNAKFVDFWRPSLPIVFTVIGSVFTFMFTHFIWR